MRALILNPPLPRILALEQDVRHHAGDRQQDEQDRADHRHGQAQVGVNASARHGEDQIRDERLHPEVQGAAAEAAEGANEVHNPHVRLLEVAHKADAQAGDQSEKTEEDYMGGSLTISIWKRKLIEKSTKSSVMHSYLVV